MESTIKKTCHNCKYLFVRYVDEPCAACRALRANQSEDAQTSFDGLWYPLWKPISETPLCDNHESGSTEKKCDTCKHYGVPCYEYPCSICWTSRDVECWPGWEAKEVDNMSDMVNHPSHYEASSSLECIDAMELAFGVEAVFHFCILNAYKYIWRWKNKNGEEDLKKARWYLDRADSYLNASPVELQDDAIEDYRASYMIANMRDYIRKCLKNL